MVEQYDGDIEDDEEIFDRIWDKIAAEDAEREEQNDDDVEYQSPINFRVTQGSGAELQARIEQAEANWQSAPQGNPGDNTWGFFSYGDAPGGIGGGVGMFTWFPNRNRLLDFIATTLPFSPPGRSDRDWGSVASRTTTIIEEMKRGTIEDLVGIEQLNEVLKTFSQIQWIGTFSELLIAEHSYPAKVRAAFRDEGDEENASAPIQPEEEEAFRKFLDTWGI